MIKQKYFKQIKEFYIQTMEKHYAKIFKVVGIWNNVQQMFIELNSIYK